jgi:V/A-type H+-transporting ATPase subunit D
MLKLTKNELRDQQQRLSLFQKYLPTLQLKKAMLQFEVNQAALEIAKKREEFVAARLKANDFSPLILDKSSGDLLEYAEIVHVKKHYENVAGAEIPVFDDIVFREADYFLFDTPVWMDQALELMREFIICREKLKIAEEQKKALERELREVSIRVNLFEKVLIPRSQDNIKKIRIFLGDQQLSAVAQAKVAKMKIKKKEIKT